MNKLNVCACKSNNRAHILELFIRRKEENEYERRKVYKYNFYILKRKI